MAQAGELSAVSYQLLIGSTKARFIGSSDDRIIRSTKTSDQQNIGSSDDRIIGSTKDRFIGSSDQKNDRISGSTTDRFVETSGH
jgi:hypothetical protein